jgi:predicted ATP-dependent endonuclease of OLD family
MPENNLFALLKKYADDTCTDEERKMVECLYEESYNQEQVRQITQTQQNYIYNNIIQILQTQQRLLKKDSRKFLYLIDTL